MKQIKSTTYSDVIGIEVKIQEVKGLKLINCFLNENGQIIKIS